MAYTKTNWVNDQTELNAENMNHIEDGIYNSQNVEIIAISDEAPSQCATGDKYYNTEDNLIYTATGTNTWSEDGEEPISGIFYILFSEQSSYSYDGTTLVSVGGGTEDIIISDTEPTEEGVKIWIDTGEISNRASEITNSYSTSTGIGYSANYVNNLLKTTIGTMTYNTTYFNTPVFNKISKSGNVVSIYFIAQKKADWSGNADIITGLPSNSFGDNFRFSAHIGDDEYIPATTSSRIMLWTQINGTSIRCYNGAIANNKYVHINLTYITND